MTEQQASASAVNEPTAMHVYVHGGNSHILRALFGGKVGQVPSRNVFQTILGGGEIDLNITSEEFLMRESVKGLKPIDQVRQWIFFNQLRFIQMKITERYSVVRFQIRWNRNKTLVSTANQTAERGVLYMDFGGGEIKIPNHAEEHDASELLRILKSGNETDISRALVRLSALVGNLMGQAAKDGVVGLKVICLCTGKYWQEIIKNVTSGGSSSEIWFLNRKALADGEDWVQMYQIPHGAKSDLFKTGLPCVVGMDRLIEACLEPPPMSDMIHEEMEEESIGRTVSGAAW